LSVGEIAYIFTDAEPTVVVCDPALAGNLASPAKSVGVSAVLTLDAFGSGTLVDQSAGLSPDALIETGTGLEPNAIVYTSGTTGKPKGAIISNGLVLWNAFSLAHWWNITPKDTLLHANPMAYGLFGTTTPVIAGGAGMVLLPKFDVDDVMRTLPRATMFAGVPTYYTRLLAREDFDRSFCAGMRLFITGSAPMRPDTFERFRVVTGHTLLDRYGLTESLIVTSNRAFDEDRRSETSGLPLPESKLRIVDEAGAAVPTGQVGMIEILQPYPFSGYWRASEKTEQALRDGWFKTGDFGRQDANGFVTVLGRGVDLIITGGLNVYPKEVETRLNEIPNVAESAVIGVPHPDFGEAVVAVIQLGDPAFGLDTKGVLAGLKGSMASYKIPKHIEIVKEMPRNTLGKILKNQLKQQLSNQFGE
jgi:malonyl-CoA/methylmalonyl-CoA synthetase